MIRNGIDSIKSKTGTYFANKKRYDFKINVNLKSPKYTIDSEELNYLIEDGKSFFMAQHTLKQKSLIFIVKLGFTIQQVILVILLRIQKLILRNILFMVIVFFLIKMITTHQP